MSSSSSTTLPSSSFDHNHALLPPCTIALMVHKLFQDRVVQHLLLMSSSSSSSSSSLTSMTALVDDTHDDHQESDDVGNATTMNHNNSSNRKKRPRQCHNSSSSSSSNGNSVSCLKETKVRHEKKEECDGTTRTKEEVSTTTSNHSSAMDDPNNNNKSSPPPPSSHLWQPYGHSTNKNENMRVLYTQQLTGVSQARRGYVLLLLTLPYDKRDDEGDTRQDYVNWCRIRLEQLSPMARQNISFVCTATHEFHVDESVSTTAFPSSQTALPSSLCRLQELAHQAWKVLTSHYGFDWTSSLLRVEVQPRQPNQADTLTHQFETDFCFQLEQQAWLGSMSSHEDSSSLFVDCPLTEPFTDQAPIQWIKSKSKCTHQLTLIVLLFRPTTNSDSSSSASSYTFTDCYWGIECRTDHPNKSTGTTTATSSSAPTDDNHHPDNPRTFPNDPLWNLLDVPLNHQAAKEIVIVPCHPKTGEELLSQHHKQDDSSGVTNCSSNGTATSTRSTPVEPLSRAYYKLHQVWKEQLQPNLDQWQLRQGCGLDLGACPGGWTQVLVEMGMPYVMAVDPGAVGHRVASLPNVTHVRSTMEEACSSGALRQHGPYSLIVCDASIMWMNVLQLLCTTIAPNATFTLPSVWVITIKLPFKTLGSIQRHVSSLQEVLPLTVQELQSALYTTGSVRARHQLLHLMANSDSERTVLIVFEPKTQRSDGPHDE